MMPVSNEFSELSGLDRIEKLFMRSKNAGKAAIMPYFTLGYPDPEISLSIIEAVAAESDMLELGLSFSDPIADGPTIQRSTHEALEKGITISKCLEMVRDLRVRGVDKPALLMGYYNPILAYGEERFVHDAAEVGVAGIIVPDLPSEESLLLANACLSKGLAFIQFLAPTSDPERIDLVLKHATGFIYMVSVTGVTGERSTIHTDLPEFVVGLKKLTNLPIAVGFGIASRAQVVEVSQYADGVIFGSALINAVDKAEDKVTAARAFVAKMAGLLEE